MDPIVSYQVASAPAPGAYTAPPAPVVYGGAAPRANFQADRYVPTQPQAQPQGYGHLASASELSARAERSAPAAPAKVSGLDRFLMPFAKNVYPTPENIQAYKAVQQLRATNKEQYLYPGSSNSAAVLDLQQKLNYIGVKANTTGTFGFQTGQAVIEFRRKAGLNDGYLDKKGQPAISEWMGPIDRQVLDQMVLQRGGGATPVGYPVAPPPVQYAPQPQPPTYAAPQPPAYQPPAYQPPSYVAPQPVAPAAPMQPAAPALPSNVNQTEYDWAVETFNRAQAKQQVTPAQFNLYQLIEGRLEAAQQGAPPPQAADVAPGVSKQHYEWALEVNTRRQQPNAQLTPIEISLYNSIATQVDQVLGSQQAPAPQAPVAPQQPAMPAMPVEPAGMGGADLPTDVAAVTGSQPVGTQQHTVRKGDTLRSIAGQYYGDKERWMPIYDANKEQLAAWQTGQPRLLNLYNRKFGAEMFPNPNLIPDGMLMAIPGLQQQPAAAPAQPAAYQPAPVAPAPGYGPLASGASPTARADGSAAPEMPSQPVTDAERLWAQQIFNEKIARGLPLTQDEALRLDDIQFRATGQHALPQAMRPMPQPAAPAAPAAAPAAAPQDEMGWAQQIQARYQAGDKTLTQDEINRYNAIVARMQAAPAPAAPFTPPTAPVAPALNVTMAPPAPMAPAAAGPSQADVAWAQWIAVRYQQQDKSLTQAEVARYNQIVAMLSAASQPPAPPAPPSQADVAWAQWISVRFNQGDKTLTAEEVARYNDIVKRMSAAPPATPTPPAQPPAGPGAPTADEMAWAQQIQARFQAQDKTLTQDDVNRYNAIVARMQGTQPPAAAAPTADEVAWAQQIQQRFQAGDKTLTQADVDKYNAIAARLAAAQQGTQPGTPAQPPAAPQGPSAQELQWAQQIQARYQQGDKSLTPDEIKRYNDIVARASQAPTAPAQAAPPAGNDLGWALGVIDQISQGYAPSPEERSKLEQIESSQVDVFFAP